MLVPLAAPALPGTAATLLVAQGELTTAAITIKKARKKKQSK